MKGESVKEVQRQVVRTGYLTQEHMRTGLGIFGLATLAALKEFQEDQRITLVGGTEGVVDRATIQALYKAKAANGTKGGVAWPPRKSSPPLVLASSQDTFRSISLDEYLSDQKGSASLAAIVIGNAEGTRTPDGGKTKGFHGHGGSGNGKIHKGSFSFPVSSVQSEEEADRKQLAAMRGVKERYLQAARKAGLDPSNALLASAYFESFNQSPSAAERFLTQLPDLKTHGITPRSVIQARVSSWVEARTQKRYGASSGMPVGGGFVDLARRRAQRAQRPYAGEPDVIRIIREDQSRRINAMVVALKRQGLLSCASQPGSAASSVQRATSVAARTRPRRLATSACSASPTKSGSGSTSSSSPSAAFRRSAPPSRACSGRSSSPWWRSRRRRVGCKPIISRTSGRGWSRSWAASASTRPGRSRG
jgi:hypothetical protein